MIGVLFIESGKSGGGSAESLYQHLRVIDRSVYRPVVVFVNRNRFIDVVEGLGIRVYVVTDWLYSQHAPPYQRKLAQLLKTKAMKLSRFLSFSHLRAMRWVHRSVTNQLARIVEEEGVDLIHLNVQVNRDLFGLFVSERTGVPCVSHLRSTDAVSGHEFTPHLARYANRVVTGYVANSSMTRDCWVSRGADRGKMQLVHNGIGTDPISPRNIRAAWSVADDVDYLVGCVTPLRNRLKVDEFLVRGFARFLTRHHSGAALVIVGDGPMAEVLLREVRVLEIDDRVILTGFQDTAKEIIAGLDASLVVSYYDSFGRVVLETMQAGTPLVATDVGSIRDIVKDEWNGLLIPYGDEDAFADALQKLRVDSRLRSRLIENGQKTVIEQFSIGSYASRLDRIYLDALGAKLPSSVKTI